MISKLKYTTPERFRYDEMGEPNEVYGNEHLIFQLYFKVYKSYTELPKGDRNFTVYSNEEYSHSKNEIYENQVLDNHIENRFTDGYMLFFENKQIHNYSLEKLVSFEKEFNECIELLKANIKNKIIQFEQNYGIETENDEEIDYDYQEYLESLTAEEYEERMELEKEDELEYKQNQLDELISPLQDLIKRINFCLKIVNENIVYKRKEVNELDKNIESQLKRYGL
jgi:hypothetical protein